MRELGKNGTSTVLPSAPYQEFASRWNVLETVPSVSPQESVLAADQESGDALPDTGPRSCSGCRARKPALLQAAAE